MTFSVAGSSKHAQSPVDIDNMDAHSGGVMRHVKLKSKTKQIQQEKIHASSTSNTMSPMSVRQGVSQTSRSLPS